MRACLDRPGHFNRAWTDRSRRSRFLVSGKNVPEATAIACERYELFLRNLGPDNAEQGATQVLEAMEVVRRQFPSPSMDRWVALACSAFVLNQAKRFPEAESMAREMFPIVDANHLMDNDPRRADGWRELGKALHGQKKGGAAEAIGKAAAIYDAVVRCGRIQQA
jgi:hypothetical protein